MGGIVKSVVGAISGKRGAKGAYQAQLRGLQGAVDEQRSIYDDISASQAGLRDANIADIEGLAGRLTTSTDDTYALLNDLLQQSVADTSALQQGAFASNEERLLANLDDILNRSQESFNYASENLMPYIKKGQEAFQQYADKAIEGFDFDYQESPGYQFIKDQALNAVTNDAAAQGMGLSGARLKGLQDRASGLAATDYANQYNRAYGEFRDDLNTLANLGNVGLSGQQSLIGREAELSNFENQARTSLSDAIAQNDFARADAEIANIMRLTGGQGELAMQAMQAKNLIDQGKTSGIIDQRSTAQSNIDRIRGTTGSNISNLEAQKGQAEANYLTERAKFQNQLLGGIVDAGIMGASAGLGAAGAFGGGGGLQGAMSGMNFGSELANFGGGQTISPQGLNFLNTGTYARPPQQPQMSGMFNATGGMQLSPVSYGYQPQQQNMGLSGVGANWVQGWGR